MTASQQRSRPIGVFDSGVGGLTVVAALQRRLPAESILYLGDTARLPYGTKSAATVQRYTQRNVEFLIDRGVKAVVVACNTASALALPHLTLPVPTWGVIEPGVKAARRQARRCVGVIATESTVASAAYPEALRAVAPDLEVVSQPCPLFVPLVEEGWADDPVALQIAQRYLEPLQAAGVDTLVLGCTHYPLLASTIRQVMGPDVTLVDSAEALAEAAAQELAAADLLNPADGPGEVHVLVTDAGERFARLARQILERDDIRLEWVEIV
jgi:glutamate racemase